MSMISNNYKLDLTPGVVPLVIFVSQYDTKARVLRFTLVDKTGATISYGDSDDVSAAIRGTKPDGMGFDYAASVSINGSGIATVTVTLTEQMTAVAGRVPCEIYLYKGEPATTTTPASNDFEQLATANFILYVERAALDKDTIKSDSDIRQLIDVVDRTDELLGAAAAIEAAYEDYSSKSVYYAEAQTLSAAQQAQARTNMGAASAADVTALAGRVTTAEGDIADFEASVPYASSIYTTANNPYAHLSDIPQNTMCAFDGGAYNSFDDKPFDTAGFGVFVETISPNKASMTGGIQRVVSWGRTPANNKLAIRAYQSGAYREWIVYESISLTAFNSAVSRLGTAENDIDALEAATAKMPTSVAINTLIPAAYDNSLDNIPANTLMSFTAGAYADFTVKPFESPNTGVFVETLSADGISNTNGLQRITTFDGKKTAIRAYAGGGTWRSWCVYDDIATSTNALIAKNPIGMDKVTVTASNLSSYPDVDAYPKNSIYIVSNNVVEISAEERVANFPSNFNCGGTIVTLNSYNTNGGTVQTVYFFNGKTATRMHTGSGWTDWQYSGYVTHVLNVQSSGGHFTNVAAALKYIMDSGLACEQYRFVVNIAEDTYSLVATVDMIAQGLNRRGLYVMPYTTIRGRGKDKTKLTFYYEGDDEQIKEYVSGLNVPYTCWIEDLTLSVSEIRYAIHSDNATEDSGDESTLTNALLNDNKITLKNVRLEHMGFANITQDKTDGKYRAPAAWGGGSWNATDREFINCDFYAMQYTAWLNHDRYEDKNHVHPTRPSNFTFKNCTFTAATGLSVYNGLAGNAASSACSLISWGSDVKTYVSFEGCYAAPCVGMSIIQTYRQGTVTGYFVTADNDLYVIESKTNDSHLADNYRTGNCIVAVCTASSVAAYTPVSQQHIKYAANFDANWVRHGIALHSCGKYDSLIVQMRGTVSLAMLGATGFASGDLIGYNGSAWVRDSTNPILRAIDQYTAEFI